MAGERSLNRRRLKEQAREHELNHLSTIGFKEQPPDYMGDSVVRWKIPIQLLTPFSATSFSMAYHAWFETRPNVIGRPLFHARSTYPLEQISSLANLANFQEKVDLS
jgi:hypothetical protein